MRGGLTSQQNAACFVLCFVQSERVEKDPKHADCRARRSITRDAYTLLSARLRVLIVLAPTAIKRRQQRRSRSRPIRMSR